MLTGPSPARPGGTPTPRGRPRPPPLNSPAGPRDGRVRPGDRPGLPAPGRGRSAARAASPRNRPRPTLRPPPVLGHTRLPVPVPSREHHLLAQPQTGRDEGFHGVVAN